MDLEVFLLMLYNILKFYYSKKAAHMLNLDVYYSKSDDQDN